MKAIIPSVCYQSPELTGNQLNPGKVYKVTHSPNSDDCDQVAPVGSIVLCIDHCGDYENHRILALEPTDGKPRLYEPGTNEFRYEPIGCREITIIPDPH